MATNWKKLERFLAPSGGKALLFLISAGFFLYYFQMFRTGIFPSEPEQFAALVAAGIPFFLAGLVAQTACFALGYLGIVNHCISYLTLGIGFVLCYLYISIFGFFAELHPDER